MSARVIANQAAAVYVLTRLQREVDGGDAAALEMGRKLNLSHLTDEECEQILKVIQRDFDIRQHEKGRVA